MNIVLSTQDKGDDYEAAEAADSEPAHRQDSEAAEAAEPARAKRQRTEWVAVCSFSSAWSADTHCHTHRFMVA